VKKDERGVAFVLPSMEVESSRPLCAKRRELQELIIRKGLRSRPQ